MSDSNAWALIEKSTGNVVNTIIWDGESSVDFGNGIDVIHIDKGQTVGFGYSYKDGKYSPPPLTEEQKEQNEQSSLQNNLSTKKSFMDEATLNIGIFQDAVDLDMATDDEKQKLTAWKKYRVLLNRIDANTSSKVTWPDKP
ncbi:tail fiber assembly protein [Pantoea agglomerans]|uniref:tail fiber assembly protein n=1 Tax=Enterobacter agglomerans TaxID=549 RepID=UPI0030D27340